MRPTLITPIHSGKQPVYSCQLHYDLLFKKSATSSLHESWQPPQRVTESRACQIRHWGMRIQESVVLPSPPFQPQKLGSASCAIPQWKCRRFKLPNLSSRQIYRVSLRSSVTTASQPVLHLSLHILRPHSIFWRWIHRRFTILLFQFLSPSQMDELRQHRFLHHHHLHPPHSFAHLDDPATLDSSSPIFTFFYLINIIDKSTHIETKWLLHLLPKTNQHFSPVAALPYQSFLLS